MPAISIVFGFILIALGLAGYLGQDAASASKTALIPAIPGVLLVLLGVLGLKPGLRKHAMHGAALVGVLCALGGARAWPKVPALISGAAVDRPRAVAAQAAMSGIGVIFTALCVRSFIAARRQAAGGGPADE